MPDTMKNITFGLGSLLGLALLVPLSGGCFGDDSSACEGALNCACYPNSANNVGLCETPLVCTNNKCVAAGTTVSLPDASTGTLDATLSDAPIESGEAAPTSDATVVGMDATPSADAPSGVEAGAGGNLVTNGNFSITTSGSDYWGIVSGSGTLTVSGDMGCVAVPANNNATLGWPEAPNPTGLSLSGSASYTLEYTAFSMMGGNVTVDAKVGQTMQPFNADFETMSDMVTSTPTPFTHTFTPEMGNDSSAGIAFMIPPPGGNVTAATTVCFENVSLVQN
jgi:hypothetical protein